MTNSSANFYATMREQILATPQPASSGRRLLLERLSRPGRSRRLGLGVLSAVSTALAVAIAVVALTVGATTNAPPAYALTRNANGSITITISQLTTGIPALNARLRELGIPETVIPITSSCHSRDGSGNIVMHPNPMFEYSGSISTTFTAGNDHDHPAPDGFHYVLAAKRLPNGKLLGFIGALKEPVPTCLPYSSTPSDQP